MVPWSRMSRIEEIDAQMELLQRERVKALRSEVDQALRAAFRELATDESLPACEIVAKALEGWRIPAPMADAHKIAAGDAPVTDDDVGDFAERLDKLIGCHRRVA